MGGIGDFLFFILAVKYNKVFDFRIAEEEIGAKLEKKLLEKRYPKYTIKIIKLKKYKI